MPRDLYPSHTGRFGGLNRQLMIARERMRDFRRRSEYGDVGYGRRGRRFGTEFGFDRFGDDDQQMPEGVAGEEWTPEAYESSPMWADAEQGLHDIIKDPPKFIGQPGDDPEKLAQQEHWQMINAPGVLQGRERNKAVLEAARISAGGKVDATAAKAFTNAMNMVKAKETTLYNMQKANQAHANTFSKNDMQTALEALNGARRQAHKLGPAAGFHGLEESLPEIAPSGLTKATQAEVERKEAARAAAKKRQAAPAMDPYGNIGMSELGLPDIFPGGIPDAKAVEALHSLGAKLDAQLESGAIDKETYDAKVTAITKPKTAAERVKAAEKELAGTPAGAALQEVYQDLWQSQHRDRRDREGIAQVPQSIGAQVADQTAGLPGSDIPGGPTESFPSPEQGLLGDEERMPSGIPSFLQQGGDEFSQPPFGTGAPQQPLPERGRFSQLPPREEIGKVPRSFMRRRIPRRERVREE